MPVTQGLPARPRLTAYNLAFPILGRPTLSLYRLLLSLDIFNLFLFIVPSPGIPRWKDRR